VPWVLLNERLDGGAEFYVDSLSRRIMRRLDEQLGDATDLFKSPRYVDNLLSQLIDFFAFPDIGTLWFLSPEAPGGLRCLLRNPADLPDFLFGFFLSDFLLRRGLEDASFAELLAAPASIGRIFNTPLEELLSRRKTVWACTCLAPDKDAPLTAQPHNVSYLTPTRDEFGYSFHLRVTPYGAEHVRSRADLAPLLVATRREIAHG